MSKAGIVSLEIQAKVRVPQEALLAFLSGSWPPYDSATGLLAFSQAKAKTGCFKVTLFLSERDAKGYMRLIIDMQAEQPEKIQRVDVPFATVGRFYRFVRRKQVGFSFRDVRGVVHQEVSSRQQKIPLPLHFNDKAGIIGLRFAWLKEVRPRPLLENVIVELADKKRLHLRLATRHFAPPKGGLARTARRILACQKDLLRMLELKP